MRNGTKHWSGNGTETLEWEWGWNLTMFGISLGLRLPPFSSGCRQEPENKAMLNCPQEKLTWECREVECSWRGLLWTAGSCLAKALLTVKESTFDVRYSEWCVWVYVCVCTCGGERGSRWSSVKTKPANICARLHSLFGTLYDYKSTIQTSLVPRPREKRKTFFSFHAYEATSNPKNSRISCYVPIPDSAKDQLPPPSVEPHQLSNFFS